MFRTFFLLLLSGGSLGGGSSATGSSSGGGRASGADVGQELLDVLALESLLIKPTCKSLCLIPDGGGA